MAQAFISYSAKDEDLAQQIHQYCENLGLNAFLASISLSEGKKWKDEIFQELKYAEWFFFLATPNSIKSDAVKHEIGGALALNKKIVPILYDIDYPDLPDWISDYQGIKIRDNNLDEIKVTLEKIAKKNKTDSIIAVAIICGLIYIFLKS